MKPNQKLSQKNGTQVALFPLENLRVTQGANDPYSHENTLAIDVNTLGVKDIAYAPFDCKVITKSKKYNTVIFESLKPVLCADGKVEVVQLKMLHDNDISDLIVGKQFLQGEKIYDEGGASVLGIPDYYPRHIHLVVLRGGNESRVEKTLFINDTNVIDGEGYDWKTYVEPVSFKVGDKVFIKKTAIKYATGQLIPPEYKKGGKYAQRPFTLAFDGDKSLRWLVHGSWLVQEIKSWVKVEDLEKV